MTYDLIEHTKQIKACTTEVVQVGCANVELHTTLLNICRRHKKVLITYYTNEAEKETSDYHGTYHIQRKWSSDVDLTKYQYVIINKQSND